MSALGLGSSQQSGILLTPPFPPLPPPKKKKHPKRWQKIFKSRLVGLAVAYGNTAFVVLIVILVLLLLGAAPHPVTSPRTPRNLLLILIYTPCVPVTPMKPRAFIIPKVPPRTPRTPPLPWWVALPKSHGNPHNSTGTPPSPPRPQGRHPTVYKVPVALL